MADELAYALTPADDGDEQQHIWIRHQQLGRLDLWQPKTAMEGRLIKILGTVEGRFTNRSQTDESSSGYG